MSLFPQYNVDESCMIKCKTIQYLRQFQQRSRTVDYRTLCDQPGACKQVEKEAERAQSGCLLVSNSAHRGHDRYLPQNVHDLITVRNHFGHSDIYLTLIYSPSRPETRQVQFSGQKARESADIRTLVFRISLPAPIAFPID